MALSDIQKKILTPFVNETIKRLQESTGLQASAQEGFEENLKTFSCKGYALVSNTTGVIEGRILMHHYDDTAAPIGKAYLEKQGISDVAEELNDDVINALADFSQSAIKPAIEELEKSDIEISFSPAYFISDTEKMGSVLEDAKQMLTIPIEIKDLGRFYFNYIINSELNV